MPITKAVILAAGMGNRIAGVGDIPKPLLSLDGTPAGNTFLDFHLRALQQAGVREIFLVGNQRTFGTKLRAMTEIEATWILNPTLDLTQSGSGHSAQFAWQNAAQILDGTSRVLLMDADIVYSPEVLPRLAQSPGSLTLVSPKVAEDGEEVVVFARPENPDLAIRHGKGLYGTPLTEGLTAVGEATGMVVIDPQDHAFIRQATDWAIEYSTAKTRSEHEDITQLMMHCGRLRIARLLTGDFFMEVDTPADYARLLQHSSRAAGLSPT